MFPSLCFFPGPPWVRRKWTGVMSGLRGTVHPSCGWNSRWVKGSETGLRMCLLHTIALLPVSSKRSQALQPLSVPSSFLWQQTQRTPKDQGSTWLLCIDSHELQIPPDFQVELFPGLCAPLCPGSADLRRPGDSWAFLDWWHQSGSPRGSVWCPEVLSLEGRKA